MIPHVNKVNLNKSQRAKKMTALQLCMGSILKAFHNVMSQ